MGERFAVTVIGSGPGGYRAAVLGALRGLPVAIVERGDWGGCCLNRGCVPKKDWYHSARMIAAGRRRAGGGVEGALRGDLERAWEHQRAVVRGVRASYLDYMDRLGVRIVEGHARLLERNRVQVSGRDGTDTLLESEHIILATGARPYVPPHLPAVPGKVLTTDALFEQPPPPGERVAVIGSGVVATEFAFILTLLGKRVEWLARSEPLHRLPFSAPARKVLREALEAHAITPRRTEIECIDHAGDAVRIAAADGALEVDWVLLGTGRTPNTANLGLQDAGVRTDARGFIERNARLQTAAENIYAVGDCASPLMTANHALADAGIAIDNITGTSPRERREADIPIVIYTAVEMARVGLDEDAAEDAGLEPAVGFAAFETSPCALGQDDTGGFVRLIADLDSRRLLGGEIIGTDAGELIHTLALALPFDDALERLTRLAYNHPARAEELQNAVETMIHRWGM